jgi:hypothetical protein
VNQYRNEAGGTVSGAIAESLRVTARPSFDVSITTNSMFDRGSPDLAAAGARYATARRPAELRSPTMLDSANYVASESARGDTLTEKGIYEMPTADELQKSVPSTARSRAVRTSESSYYVLPDAAIATPHITHLHDDRDVLHVGDPHRRVQHLNRAAIDTAVIDSAGIREATLI